MLIFGPLGIVSKSGLIWRGPDMVWKAQFEESRFSDPGRCQGTPDVQKRVRAGALQCFHGILSLFLMGRGSPGRDWCWGTPGYPPVAGSILNEDIEAARNTVAMQEELRNHRRPLMSQTRGHWPKGTKGGSRVGPPRGIFAEIVENGSKWLEHIAKRLFRAS